jgi:hypothetical protein
MTSGENRTVDMEREVLRVPILTPQNALPSKVKVLDPSLPERLSADNLATKTDLVELGAISETELGDLLTQLRIQVMEEVAELLELAKAKTFIFKQDSPVAQAILEHNFDWQGPLNVTLWSLDLQTVYEFAQVYMLDTNRIQLGFDEPITFHAIVSI